MRRQAAFWIVFALAWLGSAMDLWSERAFIITTILAFAWLMAFYVEKIFETRQERDDARAEREKDMVRLLAEIKNILQGGR